MKRFVVAWALAIAAVPALAANTSVTIAVGQPGFHGRIDINDYPPPQLLYREPVVIYPPPAPVAEPPLYLYVPAGEAKKWKKHCKKYNACGRPVYFVQETWYRDVYVPEYRERKAHAKGEKKEGKGKGPKND